MSNIKTYSPKVSCSLKECLDEGKLDGSGKTCPVCRGFEGLGYTLFDSLYTGNSDTGEEVTESRTYHTDGNTIVERIVGNHIPEDCGYSVKIAGKDSTRLLEEIKNKLEGGLLIKIKE